VAEAETSKLRGDPGLHNKPLGCGASEVYASGPACEEEELPILQIIQFDWGLIRQSLQLVYSTGACRWSAIQIYCIGK